MRISSATRCAPRPNLSARSSPLPTLLNPPPISCGSGAADRSEGERMNLPNTREPLAWALARIRERLLEANGETENDVDHTREKRADLVPWHSAGHGGRPGRQPSR